MPTNYPITDGTNTMPGFSNRRYFESEPWELKSCHSDRTFYIHEDMLRYFKSEMWKLKSSHSDRTFYIHEDVLRDSCSSLYSVCNRTWMESQERVYKFDEAVSDEVICCVLNYLYHGRYSAGTNTLTEKCADAPKIEGASLHPLLLHAQLYVFADTYIMEPLKTIASRNIKHYLKDMVPLSTPERRDLVIDLIEYAHDNLREEDALLLSLADYASFRLSELRASQRLKTLLLGSDGGFLKHLLPRLSGSSNDPFADPVPNTNPPPQNNIGYSGHFGYDPRHSHTALSTIQRSYSSAQSSGGLLRNHGNTSASGGHGGPSLFGSVGTTSAPGGHGLTSPFGSYANTSAPGDHGGISVSGGFLLGRNP